MQLCLDDALKMVTNGCNAKRATVAQLQQQLEEVEKDLTFRLQTIDSNCSRMTVHAVDCRAVYFPLLCCCFMPAFCRITEIVVPFTARCYT